MNVIVLLKQKDVATQVLMVRTEYLRGMNTKGAFNNVKVADIIDGFKDGEEREYDMFDEFVYALRLLTLPDYSRVLFSLPAQVGKMIVASHD